MDSSQYFHHSSFINEIRVPHGLTQTHTSESSPTIDDGVEYSDMKFLNPKMIVLSSISDIYMVIAINILDENVFIV